MILFRTFKGTEEEQSLLVEESERHGDILQVFVYSDIKTGSTAYRFLLIPLVLSRIYFLLMSKLGFRLSSHDRHFSVLLFSEGKSGGGVLFFSCPQISP